MLSCVTRRYVFALPTVGIRFTALTAMNMTRQRAASFFSLSVPPLWLLGKNMRPLTLLAGADVLHELFFRHAVDAHHLGGQPLLTPVGFVDHVVNVDTGICHRHRDAENLRDFGPRNKAERRVLCKITVKNIVTQIGRASCRERV